MNKRTHTCTISSAAFSALYKEVDSLSGVILPNPLLPILENILFRVESNQMVLAASDQQTSIISRLDPPSKAPEGSLQIAVPARMLKSTLKSLPLQPLALSVDEKKYNFLIQTSSGRYRITCENADDFPDVFTFPQQGVEIELSSEILQRAIKTTLFATSKDELKPQLSGVLFSLNSHALSFVATDGHRLACYRRTDIKSERQIEAIVPAKSLQLLSQLLSRQQGKEVKLTFTEKQLLVSFDRTQVIVSLLNESYPDYESIIPRNNPHLLVLSTSDLPSFKRVSIYANRATGQLRLQLKGKHITLVAQDNDFSNEATEIIYCEYEGPEMEIACKANLIIEMMGAFPQKKDLQLSLDTPSKAILITPCTQQPHEEISMLLMPMIPNS